MSALEPAPFQGRHRCGACDCQVPDDRRYDALALRHSKVLTELRKSKQRFKALAGGKR